MATTLRPLAAFLICALLLGCGIHQAGVRDTEQIATGHSSGQAGAEPIAYQVGELPGPEPTARTGRCTVDPYVKTVYCLI